MIETRQIEQLLRTCAERHILPYFRNLSDDQIQSKSQADDFVTIADQETEIFLTQQLKLLLPGSLVLGEESFSTGETLISDLAAQAHVWIVDPVDGTWNFKNGHDKFCTMLAYAQYGIVKGAWIYAPQLNKFAAWQMGQNVTINGEVISFDTHNKKLSNMNVLECFTYHHPDQRAQLQNNSNSFKELTAGNCFGVETIWMLEGRFDVLLFGKGNPWDIACAVGMITAAGGKALKVDGQPAEKDALFTISGGFMGVRSSSQWSVVKEALVKDIVFD